MVIQGQSFDVLFAQGSGDSMSSEAFQDSMFEVAGSGDSIFQRIILSFTHSTLYRLPRSMGGLDYDRRLPRTFTKIEIYGLL
jgi:hypothetical protein